MVLRDEIMRGVFAPGAPLPKEDFLCQRFGVSAITVRRALSELAALGLIERRQGTAARVSRDLPVTRKSASIGLIDSLRKTAVETEVEVLHVRHEAPPLEFSELLRLSPGEKASHSLRLRSSRAGLPIELVEAWVVMPLGRKVTEAALKKKPLYEILTAQGVQFGRVVQEISAVIADPGRASLLRTEVGVPLLRLFRLVHDQDEQPIQLFETYMPADRSRILMEVPGSAINSMGAGQVVHDTPADPPRASY